MTVKLIAIAVDDWTVDRRKKVKQWITNMGYPQGYPRWYFDYQPRCEDLVMNQEIFFMYQAAFGKVEIK